MTCKLISPHTLQAYSLKSNALMIFRISLGPVSRNWAGKDTWVSFFQPMIDAARETGSPVVAANAPRDEVREARAIGHDAMRAKPAEARADFELPITERNDVLAGDWNERWEAYFGRFTEIMFSDDADSAAARERAANIFLSQSVWDGTMGASAARALERGAPKVVLCAGCFHIERDGGTVLQFEARRPSDRVLTITVIDASSRVLRDEDRGAADIVIYGFPVSRAKRETSPPAPPVEQAPRAPSGAEPSAADAATSPESQTPESAPPSS